MPSFRGIIFYQIKPKIKLILQKIKSFECLGLAPRMGVELRDPRNSLFPTAYFWLPYAAYTKRVLLNISKF